MKVKFCMKQFEFFFFFRKKVLSGKQIQSNFHISTFIHSFIHSFSINDTSQTFSQPKELAISSLDAPTSSDKRHLVQLP